MDRRYDKKGGNGKKKWDGRKSPSSSYGKQPSSTSDAPGFPYKGTRMQTPQPDGGRHESHRASGEVEQLSRQFQNTSLEDHRFYPDPPRKSSGREQARGATFSDASIPGRSHQGASNYPPRNYSTGQLQTEKPKNTGRYTRGPRKSPDDFQVQTVRRHLDKGDKVLIMMRGCPGSGKSTLARRLQFRGVILSTDDFFLSPDGHYLFEQHRIGEAHEWNKRRALKEMRQGTSPIIIDNTNVQSWEMKPYVIGGKDLGYKVEIFEPNTPWKFRPEELARRNSHCVPKYRIERMIDKYHHNVTVDEIISSSDQRQARADQGTYGQQRW